MEFRLYVILSVFVATSAPAFAQAPPTQLKSGLAIGQKVERVILTPGQMIAPVGSEVIIKASITSDAPILAATYEWFLSNSSKGHFVQVDANPDHYDAERSPTVGVASSTYAKGIASSKAYNITRGTTTQRDDMPIAKGESWISVTSIEEGVTNITCMSPLIANWDRRMAAAAIHWVDAQWQFPKDIETESDKPIVLETEISRASDNTPRKNWIVQYELKSDAPFKFPAAENELIVQVQTDSEGLARIEVKTTSKINAESEVKIKVIQPADFGRPNLILGEGATKIRWRKGADTRGGPQK